MRRVILLSLLHAALAVGPAAAVPRHLGPDEILKIATSFAVLPQEWEGVWTIVDSEYVCDGALVRTNTVSNTLCAGTEVTVPSPSATFTCSGTWDATTIDITCIGSGLITPTCADSDTILVQGTRTGDSYFLLQADYSNTSGAGCEGIPPRSCYQHRDYGTRTAPAPA